MRNLKIPRPSWIAADKWDHFWIIALFAIPAFVFSHIQWNSLWLSLLVSTLVGLIVGLSKEVLDKLNPKKRLFDIGDVIWTTIGGLFWGLATLILYLIVQLIEHLAAI